MDEHCSFKPALNPDFPDIIMAFEEDGRAYYYNYKLALFGTKLEQVLETKHSDNYELISLCKSQLYGIVGYTEITEIDGKDGILIALGLVQKHGNVQRYMKRAKKIPPISWKQVFITANKSIKVKDPTFYYNRNITSNGYSNALENPFDNTFKEATLSDLRTYSNLCGYFNDVSIWINDVKPKDCIKKFFGIEAGYMAGNKVTHWNSLESIFKWLEYSPPKKRMTATQKTIDAITSIELPSHELSNGDKKNNIAYVDRIDFDGEKFIAIRTISKGVEAGRIYVSKKDIIPTKFNGVDYIPYPQWKTSSHNWKFELKPYQDNLLDDTLLSYYQSIMLDISINQRGIAMWLLLSCPICEKIAKYNNDGYEAIKALIKFIWRSQTSVNPIKRLELFWGKINNKSSKLHQQLGLSPSQLNYFMHTFMLHTSKGTAVDVANIKKLSGLDNLASIDEDTFQKLLLIGEDIQSKYTRKGDRALTFYNIRLVWGLSMAVRCVFKIIEISSSTQFDHRCYQTLIDVCNMIGQLSLANEIKPDFWDSDSINRAHAMLSDLINAKKEELLIGKWNTRKTVWGKWKYEDEAYSVIIPDTPNDLAIEGITLRHCVKSYIPRVSAGDTNVVFIRDNTALDKPFFTVEISNDGYVEQIHGSYNRNLDTEPSLIPFVKKWAKEKKLKLTNIDKVR